MNPITNEIKTNNLQYPQIYDNYENKFKSFAQTAPRKNAKDYYEIDYNVFEKKDLSDVYRKKVGLENLGNSCYL